MNITFIAVVAFVILAIIQGWRKGLLNILLNLGSWIIIIVMVSLLQNPIGALLSYTPLYEDIYAQTEDYFVEQSEGIVTTEAEVWWDEMTSIFPGHVANRLQTVVEANTGVSDVTTADLSESQDTLLSALVAVIAKYICQAVAAFVVFVIAEVLFILITYILKKLDKLPVIRNVNGSAGAAVGFFEGVVWVWIAMYLVACVASSPVGNYIVANIASSRFLTFIYNFNPIIYVTGLFL